MPRGPECLRSEVWPALNRQNGTRMIPKPQRSLRTCTPQTTSDFSGGPADQCVWPHNQPWGMAGSVKRRLHVPECLSSDPQNPQKQAGVVGVSITLVLGVGGVEKTDSPWSSLPSQARFSEL